MEYVDGSAQPVYGVTKWQDLVAMRVQHYEGAPCGGGPGVPMLARSGPVPVCVGCACACACASVFACDGADVVGADTAACRLHLVLYACTRFTLFVAQARGSDRYDRCVQFVRVYVCVCVCV